MFAYMMGKYEETDRKDKRILERAMEWGARNASKH